MGDSSLCNELRSREAILSGCTSHNCEQAHIRAPRCLRTKTTICRLVYLLAEGLGCWGALLSILARGRRPRAQHATAVGLKTKADTLTVSPDWELSIEGPMSHLGLCSVANAYARPDLSEYYLHMMTVAHARPSRRRLRTCCLHARCT